ncbi:MAG: glycolate oxidase subunit GlcF [Gammaproteobacteria bacterium]|jgi:glycolate oxidase iron-sulfur subunit
MQYSLSEKFKNTTQGQRADEILGKCVHCGMCTATCPTYQLLGDELDGPRGRIYQIKQVLEGEQATATMQLHLDRCLTCLSCETTCPSGVEYGKLAEIGKEIIEEQVTRPLLDRIKRKLLRLVIPYPARFAFFFKIGLFFKVFLPASLKQQMNSPKQEGAWPKTKHSRKMLVLNGCVQSVMSSNINAAAARVLDKLEISLLPVSESGCCGAVSLHLQASEEAKTFMRNNIDAWWPYIEDGIEAIVMTASGCGTVVKDYADHLSDDALYAEKAKRVSELVKDISEIIANEDLSKFITESNKKIAAHIPCSLQHGQQLNGVVETILTKTGYTLTLVKDAHLCCGSAGTYSLLQTEISNTLRDNKLDALQKGKPDLITTANIGCLHHLQSGTEKPVLHWIELLDKA